MATTFDAILAALNFMGRLFSGVVATTGSPTTLSDPGMLQGDNYFTGGTLLFPKVIEPATSHTITGFDGTTNTFTFSPSRIPLTAGMIYYATVMSMQQLLNAVNAGLLAMGEYTEMAEHELTADASGLFPLPASVQNVKRLEVISYVYADGVPSLVFSRRVNVFNWRELSNGKIVFEAQVSEGDKIKLRIFYGAIQNVTALDTQIKSAYHLERLGYEAAYFAYFQYLAQQNNSSDKDLLMFQTIMQQRRSLAARYPVPSMFRDPILPRN